MATTFVIDYTIDPSKTADFERYAAEWIRLVEREGGVHHGASGGPATTRGPRRG